MTSGGRGRGGGAAADARRSKLEVEVVEEPVDSSFLVPQSPVTSSVEFVLEVRAMVVVVVTGDADEGADEASDDSALLVTALASPAILSTPEGSFPTRSGCPIFCVSNAVEFVWKTS